MNKKLQAEAKRDGVESVTKAPVHDVLPPRRKRLFHRRRDLRKPQKGLVVVVRVHVTGPEETECRDDPHSKVKLPREWTVTWEEWPVDFADRFWSFMGHYCPSSSYRTLSKATERVAGNLPDYAKELFKQHLFTPVEFAKVS